MAACLNGGVQNPDIACFRACAFRRSYGSPCLHYVLSTGNYLTFRPGKRWPVPLRACLWQPSPILVLLSLYQSHILSHLCCITDKALHLVKDKYDFNRSCIIEGVLDYFDPGDHQRVARTRRRLLEVQVTQKSLERGKKDVQMSCVPKR